jgi:hypothetical protein
MNKFFAISIVLFLVIVMGAVLNSCSKANEAALKQKAGITSSNCDTINMKYQSDILPILTSQCYSCHSAQTYQTSGSGLNYQDFNTLKSEINNGNLLNAIQHTGNVTPMPLNLPQLSDCEINKIKDWINNGSLNN